MESEEGSAATRTRLLAERAEVTRRLAGLSASFDEVVAASRDTNADDEHDPEGATIAFERSQVDAVGRLAREHLIAVDAALARVDAGSYGVCLGCGDTIAAARLTARPSVATCMACAAR